MGYYNKQDEFKQKIAAEFPGLPLIVSGEYRGKWQFMVEYPAKEFNMTPEIEQQIKQVSRNVDLSAPCYVMPLQ